MTTTQTPTTNGRSALHQLNGDGGPTAAAHRLAAQEIHETLTTLINAIRAEERRTFAEQLVTRIAEQTTRLGHIDKTEAITIINRMARRPTNDQTN